MCFYAWFNQILVIFNIFPRVFFARKYTSNNMVQLSMLLTFWISSPHFNRPNFQLRNIRIPENIHRHTSKCLCFVKLMTLYFSYQSIDLFTYIFIATSPSIYITVAIIILPLSNFLKIPVWLKYIICIVHPLLFTMEQFVKIRVKFRNGSNIILWYIFVCTFRL